MNGALGRSRSASDRIAADLPVARYEMQAVRGDQAVERRQRQRGRQVPDQRRELDGREAGRDGRRIRPERPRVAIHGHDPRARPEQVGQGQGERPLPCPDIGPGTAGRRDARHAAARRDPHGP